MQMEITANTKDDANTQVETACKKLLANLIMEDYTFTLTEL
jgi:phosphoribosylformylglycinamidine synthase subunit PurS